MTRPRYPKPRQQGSGKEMNDYERAFESTLRAKSYIGKFEYEGTTLLLCEGVTYKPDFRVVLPDRIRMVEVKAGDKNMKPILTDGSRYKLRMAVSKFWEYEWILAVVRKIPKKDGGGWQIKEINLNAQDEDGSRPGDKVIGVGAAAQPNG